PIPTTYYRRPDNVTGSPKPVKAADADLVYKQAAGPDALVNDFGMGGATPDTRFILPSKGLDAAASPIAPTTAYNQGYYLLGPGAFPGGAVTPTFPSPGMQYRAAVTGATPDAPTVMLQRLACPHMPPQTNPTLPNFNPYVTVDYMP